MRFLVLLAALVLLALAQAAPEDAAPGETAAAFFGDARWYSVRAYGAVGDGTTDDTGAFAEALAAAGDGGGVVLVPPVGPGKGYVITRTLHVPAGVTLMGSPAGLSTNATAAFPLPDPNVVGAKVFARPAEDQYSGAKKAPLFELDRGCTVRGLFILYDEQPWPTDAEFQDPASPYHYASFSDAKARFVEEHVKPYGPTFYIPRAVNVVIEDICCDRYYDFLFMRKCGKTFVNRIMCYGYRRGFVYGEGLDVNRLSHVHGVPNAGPACPGPVGGGKTYTWIYAIVTSHPEHVGVHLGRCDGYTLEDIVFFGIHTGIRLGCSKEFPLYDPVANEYAYQDPETRETVGFLTAPYTGQGPWGDLNGLKIDQCVVGVHFVWPTHLTNRFTNCLIFTALDDGREFAATAGTGDLGGLGRQAAFLVEPSHSVQNNAGLVSAFFCANTAVASFRDDARFGPAAADARHANGRVFLIDGDITMDFTGFNANFPYLEDKLHAYGPGAQRTCVRIRGFTRSGEPIPDFELRCPGNPEGE